MQMILRAQSHTQEEIALGHKVSFTIQDGVDAVSASSNLNGYTPLKAVLRVLGADQETFEPHVNACQLSNRVLSVQHAGVNLILVPSTRGEKGFNNYYQYYAIEVLKQCNYHDIKTLHFTHYGFITKKFQQREVYSVLVTMLNPLVHTTVEKIFFEIDSRYLNDLVDLFTFVKKDIYRLRDYRPQVLMAPQFEYVTKSANKDGSSWAELRMKQE
jgi:hypothetical protein